ncbi:MAG TPA: universal stress protein [Steroidobacteraceae bacterium]|jgi:Universal stress protein UspA and related nucleotide-binding proteins|nr:universal stress protein [Steroidobacteraceae bacterium]
MTAGRMVCATDLAARSEFAVNRAVLLAQQTGVRLTLVHAVDARRSERHMRAQVNRAYVQLLTRVDRTFGSASAAIDIVVRSGGPLDVIAQVAGETNADLVVLAAPQRRRRDSIIGTTAERLLRAIGRPVLVVHRAVQGSYRRVAMAVDLSNTSLPMIQAAARLGVLDNAETTLLHATSAPHEGMLRTVGVDEQALDDYKHGWQDDARLRLQAMLTAAEMDVVRTRILIRPEPPAAAIRRVLAQDQPELLTIGASRWLLIKRLLIGSVTDSLLRTAMSDVLVIPQISHAPVLKADGISPVPRPPHEQIPAARS